MKLQGSLAERDVPDLIHVLHQRRFSGVLTLTHGGMGRRVIVQEGRLVFASSSDPDDRMGELLLRQGRITLRQYTDAGNAIVLGIAIVLAALTFVQFRNIRSARG